MFYVDPTYIILIPAVLLSIYAQAKVTGTFNKYLRVNSLRRITGSQAARMILDNNGLYDVPVEVIPGDLTDHYDPSSRVLRLSSNVYYGDSVASVGVAAHEVGHAIQHQNSYTFLMLRNTIFPVANIGSKLSWILIILGFVIGMTGLVQIGALLFAAVVLFQIVTLPVEFDASARALKQLEYNSILYDNEIHGAKKVLSAAALTYVAATLMAVLQLVRLLIISRDND